VMGAVTFNFITIRPDGAYCLYLVEEPPVVGEFIDRLRSIQSRLYEAVEAVIQGNIAKIYPESVGRKIYLRLCCYDLPRDSLDQLFARFTTIMRTHEEWKAQCEAIEFEITHDTLGAKNEKNSEHFTAP
jgi:hypothetical protein